MYIQQMLSQHQAYKDSLQHGQVIKALAILNVFSNNCFAEETQVKIIERINN